MGSGDQAPASVRKTVRHSSDLEDHCVIYPLLLSKSIFVEYIVQKTLLEVSIEVCFHSLAIAFEPRPFAIG